MLILVYTVRVLLVELVLGCWSKYGLTKKSKRTVEGEFSGSLARTSREATPIASYIFVVATRHWSLALICNHVLHLKLGDIFETSTKGCVSFFFLKVYCQMLS